MRMPRIIRRTAAAASRSWVVTGRPIVVVIAASFAVQASLREVDGPNIRQLTGLGPGVS
jgi:hypothetical protein